MEALILGIIQGLTEFLPVSSSGHLELGAHFLNVESESNLLFAITVHGATALSTVVVFRNTIYELLFGVLKFKWNEETKFVTKIVVSMIPIGLVGVLFEDKIAELFAGNMILVASMLSITGILLLLSHFVNSKEGQITFTRAFLIGVSQALAIFPGVSRSGATISTALLLGIEKSNAARFSFLMVLPPILGASLLKILVFLSEPDLTSANVDTLPLFIGFLAAFVSGIIACTWMINIVKKGKLIYFAAYCIFVSIIVFITIF